jgi:hypothetical protein
MKIGRALSLMAVLLAAPAFAQAPPLYSPTELDRLVARIALYPDPLLAQVLAAATFSEQIPAAAVWADQHHDLAGQALADAMQADQLPWDPAVQALLPFVSALDMMASDMRWTTDLGNAFLAQQIDIMDALQRQRRKARDFGYLRSDGQILVDSAPYVTIVPAKPAFIAVPSYDPDLVFSAPPPGSPPDDAIRFEAGVNIGGFRPYGWNLGRSEVIGSFFRPWGWGVARFDWGAHIVIINNVPWLRSWANRHDYVHLYPGVRRFLPADRGL